MGIDGDQEKTHIVPQTVTKELVEDFTGEYDLSHVKELILREMDIHGFEESCAEGLSGMEILSLSHNRLERMEHFQHFVNLTELNLNFNDISQVGNLECFELQKLFLSNNKITTITSLRELANLNTLSLYGNHISDLDETVSVLRQMTKLRRLDLDGNPCARNDAYRYRVILALPRLEELDGSSITTLDKDLATEFFESKKTIALERPVTAPPQSNGFSSKIPARDSLPKGTVKLFRSEFFNTNPILLEYLAQEALGGSGMGNSEMVSGMREEFSKAQDTKGELKSFVNKLRGSANESKEEIDDNASERECKPEVNDQRTRLSSTSDPSDPHSIIRKLLLKVDMLQNENEMLQNNSRGSSGASFSELLNENNQLRIENNNLPVLQQENKELRRKLADFKTGHSSREEELMKQNSYLKGEVCSQKMVIKKLEGRIQTLESSSKQQSVEEVLDESAVVDIELTELIRKNEESLKQLRQDVRRTKRQMHMDRANELSGQARPQTSAGFGDADLGPAQACFTSFREELKPPERRIYTSAGRGVNLISRDIASEEDVLEAKNAIERAQTEMEVLHKAREILVSRGNTMGGRSARNQNGDCESRSSSRESSEMKDDSPHGSEDEYSRTETGSKVKLPQVPEKYKKAARPRRSSHSDILVLH